MIPTIGFIIATYCIARLIQVPIEAIRSERTVRLIALSVVSLGAAGLILLFAADLWLAGSSASSVPVPR